MRSSIPTRGATLVVRARPAIARVLAATPRSATLLAACLLATSPALAPAQAAQPPADRIRAAVAEHRARHELAVIEELRTLLAVPNVAADLPNIRRNAELLVADARAPRRERTAPRAGR